MTTARNVEHIVSSLWIQKPCIQKILYSWLVSLGDRLSSRPTVVPLSCVFEKFCTQGLVM